MPGFVCDDKNEVVKKPLTCTRHTHPTNANSIVRSIYLPDANMVSVSAHSRLLQSTMNGKIDRYVLKVRKKSHGFHFIAFGEFIIALAKLLTRTLLGHQATIDAHFATSIAFWSKMIINIACTPHTPFNVRSNDERKEICTRFYDGKSFGRVFNHNGHIHTDPPRWCTTYTHWKSIIYTKIFTIWTW